MKKLTRIALAAVLFTATLGAQDTPGQTNEALRPQLSDEQVGELLQRAVMLAQFGFFAEAEEYCKQILQQRPGQPTAKELLNEIQRKRQLTGRQDPAADLKRKLEAMILPQANFRNAPLLDVIAFLKTESQRLSPDGAPLNFVWMVPEDAKLPRVTLNLQNVPMLDIIRYVTELTGLRYRVDPHAVVIFKPEPPKPALPKPDVRPQ